MNTQEQEVQHLLDSLRNSGLIEIAGDASKMPEHLRRHAITELLNSKLEDFIEHTSFFFRRSAHYFPAGACAGSQICFFITGSIFNVFSKSRCSRVSGSTDFKSASR